MIASLPTKRIWATAPTSPQSPGRRQGFTLVELMVSIVIVAVLASLVVLFTKRGLQSAKAAKCMSNMRQIHTGVMGLTEDGVRNTYNPKGSYPPYAGHETGPFSKFVWIDLVAYNMGIAEFKGGRYIFREHPKDTIFQNPLSEHTLGGDGEWEGEPIVDNKPDSGGSYCYNHLVGNWVAKHKTPDTVTITRTGQLKYPANTIMFGETDDKRTGARWFFSGVANAPQGNYKNGAHCAFVDGHIERIPNNHMKDTKWFNHYRAIYVEKPDGVGGPKKELAPPE